MPDDATSKARVYGEKADDCLRRASITAESFIAAEYQKLAKAYRDLEGLEAAPAKRMADKLKDA
jgi:hypothetical protein